MCSLCNTRGAPGSEHRARIAGATVDETIAVLEVLESDNGVAVQKSPAPALASASYQSVADNADDCRDGLRASPRDACVHIATLAALRVAWIFVVVFSIAHSRCRKLRKKRLRQNRHGSCCAKAVLMPGLWIKITRSVLVAAIMTLPGLGCAQLPATFLGSSLQAPLPTSCVHAVATQRSELALERLRRSYQGPAWVRVSDSPKPGAYSWADGSICITKGLINLLDDDEISAVIAHELGHLTHCDSASLGFALGGLRTENEQCADAVGVMLLRLSGVPPTSLAHALIKVRDAPQTAVDLRRSLTARIALLPK